MAGPNLPVNVDTTYADSGTDPSVKLHQQHHDAIHAAVNKISTTAPQNGQVPVATNGVYEPSTISVTARPIYLQVASNDAGADFKAGADYVCDGTADQVQINQALDRAAPLQSRNANQPVGAEQLGKVLLSGGRFNISSPNLMRTGTWLQGCGFLTELRAVGNSGAGIITLASPSEHLCHVSDMYIYGNSSSGGSCDGINFDMTASGNTSTYPDTNPDSDHLIHDLYLDQFTGTAGRNAIRIWSGATSNNRGNILDRIQVRDCTGNGIELSSASDSYIANAHVGGCDVAYRIATGNTKINNCKSFYSVSYGVYATSGRGTITGFESQDDQTGLYLDAAPWSCAALTIDTSGTAGLRVGSSEMVIAGFSIFLRSSGRFASGSIGLHIDAAHTDVSLTGTVNPANITTPISGTVGSRSFMRVSNGTTMVSAG